MKKNQLTNSEIASFASQMALILHAGISAYEGIAIMKEDNDIEDMQPILDSIFEQLDSGQTLSMALSESQAFPSFMLNMVQIGEESGELEEVMQSLSIHYQRLYENNESLKSAITYPLIMMVMMFLVVLVLITQVLPIFNKVFEQLGSSISGFSKVILDFGMILSNHAYIFIGLFFILVLLFFYFTKSENGKDKLYDFLGRWRFTKNISLKSYKNTKTKNKLTEMDVTIKYWRLSATVLKRTDAMLHFPIQYTVGRITAISRCRATLPWQQKDIADKNGISTSKKNRSIAAIPCPI